MTNDTSPSEMDVRTAKPSLMRRLSLVWLVPLLALSVSLWVAYQNYLDRGTLIEIAFENAAGITNETTIKFRDVIVGTVEDVEFAEGLKSIIVHARINKEIAPYLDQDAKFWVVRPDVSVRGITGLDTVLSGVYIEGSWNEVADLEQLAFQGLETPPLTRAGQRGIEITLTASEGGSLAKGAPILHKGIQVGYLDEPRLAPNGRQIRVTAFIEAPFDRRITTATRFWDTSGFSLSVGTGGLSLNVSSIASLIQGGIAFDTFGSGGQVVSDAATFAIFDNETAARDSLFIDPDREVLEVAAFFDGSVSGLSQGSEVRYRGIRIGQVSDLNAVVVDTATGPDVQLRTTLSIEPRRMGLEPDATAEDALELLTGFVAEGLRVRLISGGLLSQTLVVQLTNVEDAPPAQIEIVEGEPPVLPTTDNEITDAAATAEGLLQRVNDLPVEELMNGAIDVMASIETIANSEGLRAAPDEILAILQEVRAIVASDAIQAIPADVDLILTQLDDAIANINGLTKQAVDAELVGKIADAIDTANTAVGNIDAATGNLPEIMAEVEALTAKANGLDIEGLLAATTETLNKIDTLVASEEVAALPVSVSAALDEVRGLIADVRDGGAVDNLNAALASTSAAAASVESAAGDLPDLSQQASDLLTNIDTALANLPQITAEIEALTAKANSLEVEALVVQTTDTLNAMEALIANPDVAALPASLSAALDEASSVLTEIREGGALENVNAALNSANEAAQAIEEAAASLPALTQRANALAAQTGAVLENFGERGRFNAETLATLRDIQDAADAVSSLARAIQRNPNSLLTGR